MIYFGQFRTVIATYLDAYNAKINKNFKNFMIDTLTLYMVIQNKINFLQLGRYGKCNEKTYRENFKSDFKWFDFNKYLATRNLTGTRKAIAIDPSYISKSGKMTPWVGYFWSGCASAMKIGLEILGVGLLDIDNKDCFSLQAIQTPDNIALGNVDKDAIPWYAAAIISIKDKLLELSKYIVADAYFSKSTFVDKITK
ncbi:MAG: hypothetical protein R3Y50_09920 [Rikenellaceae bacterium]